MIHKLRVMTFVVVLVLAALAQAQTFTTLYNFAGSGGDFPVAGVIQDPAGNLYGTTEYGGDLNCYGGLGCGAVYKLDTAGTETVLHSFSGSDGKWPVTPVVRDSKGNIYGSTVAGGSSSNCRNGCGTVFKIDTAGNETVLYNFTGSSDGCSPEQGLVRDKAGTLYGTTNGLHCSSYGTIFKIDCAGNFTVLHSFTGSDGWGPASNGHLTLDKSGDLYGVTWGGGADGEGVLYELRKKGTFTVLYSFTGGAWDGCGPVGSVAMDSAGNFYGATNQCGPDDYGTIWKVYKKGKDTILHSFAGGWEGCYPDAGVTWDPKGYLYGVVGSCGANNYGTLYELSAKGKLTLLHSFDWSDGTYPEGEVLLTTKGTLFGTAAADGSGRYGTVWKYVP